MQENSEFQPLPVRLDGLVPDHTDNDRGAAGDPAGAARGSPSSVAPPGYDLSEDWGRLAYEAPHGSFDYRVGGPSMWSVVRALAEQMEDAVVYGGVRPRAGWLEEMRSIHRPLLTMATDSEAVVAAPELATSKWNDAIVHGVLDPELLAEEVEISFSPDGEQTYKGRWKTKAGTVGNVFEWLSEHKVGEKDGMCFMQGAVVGGDRNAAAVKHQDFLVLDCDTGEPLEAIKERLKAFGKLALLYSTHSHMKTTSEIKRDALVKWAGLEEDEEPTEEQAIAYLLDAKHYHPDVLKGATLKGVEHTPKGVMVFVSHQPMPKARIVFVLAQRFSFSKGGTQQALAKLWKERYAGVAKTLDLAIDPTCVDLPRLFFLPRHAKGASFSIDIFAGDYLDLEAMPRVTAAELKAGDPFSAAGKELGNSGGGSYQTSSLKWFFGKYGDRFEMADFLAEVDPDGDRGGRGTGPGRTHRCPNDDMHTDAGNPEDKGFFTINALDSETGQCVGKCMHASCADLDRINFVDLACQAVGIRDATELKKWVPELEGEEEAEGAAVQPFKDVGEAMAAAEALSPNSTIPEKQTVLDRLAASSLSALEEEAVGKKIRERTGMKPSTFKAAKRDAFTKIKDGSAKRYTPETIEAFQAVNKRYGYLNEGMGKMIRFEEDGSYTYKTLKGVEFEFAHETVRVGGEPKILVPAWLKWEGKRRYSGTVFLPGKTEEEAAPDFNLYRGWGVVPTPGDWSLMQRHIRHVLAGDNAEVYQFIVGTLAHILQNVGNVKKKLTTALVVRGAHGAGKSYPFECYGRIFGDHYMSLSKPEQVLGKFNAHFGKALFVILEEAVFARDPKNSGPLKDLITGETMMLERKGIDPLRVPNYAHYVVISNARDPVPLPPTERRYFPIEASDEYGDTSDPERQQRNLDYFVALRRQMDEQGGTAAMAWDLLRWTPPGGDWSFLRKPPATPEKDRMIGLQLSPFEKFMVEFAYHGEMGPYCDPTGKSDMKITLDDNSVSPWTTTEIATAFRCWLLSQPSLDRAKANGSPAAVGIALSNMFPAVPNKATGTQRLKARDFPSRPAVLNMLRTHPNRGYAGLLSELEKADE